MPDSTLLVIPGLPVKYARALLIDLSLILPEWAILMKRPMSFQVVSEMKIVDDE